MKARGYQADLIGDLNQCFAAGHHRVCLQLETGGGKGWLASFMGQNLVGQYGSGQPLVLYIVHRRELVRQLVQKLSEFVGDTNVGVIASGKPISPWAPIQVASLPTLYRRIPEGILDWLKPRLVFVDEAHHIRARTWEETCAVFQGIPFVGLTATPARLDGKGLISHFEVMVRGPSYLDLVRIGALARVEVFSPDVMDTRALRKQAGEYSKSQQEARLNHAVIADVISNYRRYADGQKMIMFSVTQRASEEAVQMFVDAGIPARHVDAGTDEAVRDQSFRDFERGEFQILGNVELATEGVDVPDCQGVILARRTMSYGLYKQMVGRGSRPLGGDNTVLDCANNFDEHGHPMAPVEWSLEDGVVEASIESAKSLGRRCAECSYIYPPSRKKCPLCGTVHKTRTAIMSDAELKKKNVDDQPKPAGGPKRNINQLVRMSGGDEATLRELAKRTKRPASALRNWRRIFGPLWEQDRQRAEARERARRDS